MLRLLIINGSMNVGGAETFIMKIYRNIDRTKYQFDFAVGIKEEGAYDKEILSLGGKIYHITPKSKNLKKFYKDIKKVVRDNNYDYVLRMSQFSISALDLLAAKQGDATHLIMRSTNSQITGGTLGKIINKLFSWMPKIIPTAKFGPSTESADFLFGKNSVKNGKAKVIHNAVPINNFIFNYDIRSKKRKELGLEDKNFVVCHIGRFDEQKNHQFLIDVFNEVYKRNNNAILLLVGDGVLKEQIKNKVNNYGLQKHVKFLGLRKDVPEILMASDVDVFPSLYEGMPNTIIEAQATGLPCIISDTITKEVNITGNIKFLSLNSNINEWVNEICTVNLERNDMREIFIKSKYDIDSVCSDFINIVFENEI